MDLTRREFVLAGTLALPGGSVRPQIDDTSDNPQQEYEFRGAAHLIGPASARPAPGSDFFDNKLAYAYVYEDFNGARSYLEDGDSAWSSLNYASQVNVFSSADLPAPTNGRHTLQDNTVYRFYGFVTSPYGIELGNATPLVGRHGAADGFIHTGTNTALVGTDAGFFARDLYFHAPGGTMFGLSANASTEMLVESCSFSDAAGIGQIGSLGTISGYRVPSFKGCNFEEFAGGITFDGSPRKIFFEGCPFRNITASGVTIVTLASTLDTEIAKLSTDCYVKDVVADTEVLRTEPGGEPGEYLKIINVDVLDPDLQRSNILTGALSGESVGVIVTDSYPLANSKVTADLDLDAATTVTGSGAGPARVAGANITSTTTLMNAERTSKPTEGVIRYGGKPDQKLTVHTNMSVSGANTEFAVYLGKNGSVIPRSRSLGFLANSSSPTGTVSLAEIELTTGDTVSAYLENTGGTKDLTAETMGLTL